VKYQAGKERNRPWVAKKLHLKSNEISGWQGKKLNLARKEMSG
jgi:hypothetical protein